MLPILVVSYLVVSNKKGSHFSMTGEGPDLIRVIFWEGVIMILLL